MAPGQPHLLAGGVEGDGQAGHDPVAGADRFLGEEERGFGVDEGGGAAVGDGDALGPAGGAGGEDDPRVVVGAGAGGAVAAGAGGARDVDVRAGADHRPYSGLAEDEVGAFVGVLGVDGHVGGARGEDGEDGHVQVVGAGGDAYADPVTGADPGGGEGAAASVDLGGQRAVGEAGGAVVEGGFVGVGPYGGFEDVDEGAGRGGGPGAETGGLAGLLVRCRCSVRGVAGAPVVEESEFSAFGCGWHRPSRVVPANGPVHRLRPDSPRLFRSVAEQPTSLVRGQGFSR